MNFLEVDSARSPSTYYLVRHVVSIYLLFAFTSISSAEVYTNWYAVGLKFERDGQYQEAIDSYMKASDSGLSDAKLALGRLYRDEIGDYELSFDWFLSAARSGNSFAQYEVGYMYAYGTPHLIPDIEEAEEWFLKANRRGRVKNSAYELFKISSTNEDRFKWLVQAAEAGNTEAMSRLSEAYASGYYGTDVDRSSSLYWAEQVKDSNED